jgi:CheY-like chemotaxis protein
VPSEKKRVLVIEDAADIQVLLKILLESEGYGVESAQNGLDALELMHSMRELPNLILLDLMMPVMDGFEFRKEQKRDTRFAEIPVVVLTANPDDQAKRIRVGAKAWVKKPLEVDELLDVVKKNCA